MGLYPNSGGASPQLPVIRSVVHERSPTVIILIDTVAGPEQADLELDRYLVGPGQVALGRFKS